MPCEFVLIPAAAVDETVEIPTELVDIALECKIMHSILTEIAFSFARTLDMFVMMLAMFIEMV